MKWTTELVMLIERLVSKVLSSSVRTNIPAQVVSYDPDENTCSVQPCIMRIRTDDPNNLEPIALPQVDDIPVKHQGSGKLGLFVAPQIGSYGELRVFDRDISRWIQEGGTQPAGSTRTFHFSDAVFDPGLYPLREDGDNGKLPVPVATDRISLRLRDGTAEVSVLDDGSVEIKFPSGKTMTLNEGSDAASLASKVDSYISSLDAVMRTAWVVEPADGGAALKAAYIAAIASPPTTTASTELKLKQ
jgi:hypothetical protein